MRPSLAGSLPLPPHAKTIALLLAVAAVMAYCSNLLLHLEGDAAPNILTAASWVAQGNADLDEYVGTVPFDVQQIGGHAYPYTPPGAALVAVVPIATALLFGAQPGTPEFVALFGKLAGVLTAGLSVYFVYLACALVARPFPALIATIGYAFGTTVWSISAQQLWMHGPAQLFTALGIFLIVRGGGSPRAGLALGLATIIRPAEATVAGAGILAARRRSFSLRYIGWGLPPATFLLVYYLIAFSGPRQSYAGLVWSFPPPGLFGLLVSPSRGLFIYSPICAFAVISFALAWRAGDERSRLVRELAIATAGIFLLYSLFDGWYGGWSFGPRYMGDALPPIAIGLAYGIDRGVLHTVVARAAMAVAMAWSLLINFAGAGWFYYYWNGYHWDATPSIDLTSYRVWDWTDPQWWFVLRRMALDPGWTLMPVTFGVLVAAVLVWRAYRIVWSDSRSPAEDEQVVQPQLKGLVPQEVERA